MCCTQKKQGCEKPENLKGKPEDCMPEQIRRCHGNIKEHQCSSTGIRKEQAE